MTSRLTDHGTHRPGRTTLGAAEHALVGWWLAKLDAADQSIRDAWIEHVEPPTPSNYRGGAIRLSSGDRLSLYLTTDRDMPWCCYAISFGAEAQAAGAPDSLRGMLELDSRTRALVNRIVIEAHAIWLRRQSTQQEAH